MKEKELDSLRQKAIQIFRVDITSKFIEGAMILRNIRDTARWKAWDYKSFPDYLWNDLDMRVDRATKLLKTLEFIERHKITPDEAAFIGLARLILIYNLRGPALANSLRLIRRSEGISYETLRHYVQRELKPAIKERAQYKSSYRDTEAVFNDAVRSPEEIEPVGIKRLTFSTARKASEFDDIQKHLLIELNEGYAGDAWLTLGREWLKRHKDYHVQRRIEPSVPVTAVQ